MKMKKLLATGLATAMAVTTLAGCGSTADNNASQSAGTDSAAGSTQAAASNDDVTTITIYAYNNSTTEAAEKVAAAVSEITEPAIGVKVNLLTGVSSEQLNLALASGEDLKICVKTEPVMKKGDGVRISGARILPQKQSEALYTVIWHPIGGQPNVEELCALSDVIRNMEDVEIRLAPDETAYIINLTGTEVEKVLEATPDSAETVFETSVSCIGASICQVGLRDSQALLHACVQAVRKAEIPNGALPQIHISGCPSSCGTHQTGVIGFRGAVKRVDDQMKNAFVLFANGEERQGEERMGREIGTMEEAVIPQFLVELGQTVAASGMDYKKWAEKNPQVIDAVAANYL